MEGVKVHLSTLTAKYQNTNFNNFPRVENHVLIMLV